MKAKAQSTPLACIILAAGKGTRMRSKLPKVMHEVARKPMLMHVVDTALELQAQKVVVVTSPDMGSVREAVKRQYGDAVDNAIQQRQLGTGDAVKAVKAQFKDFRGIVVILYGDTPLVLPETLALLIAALKADAKLAVSLLGMEIDMPNEYGRIVVNKKGEADSIVEVRDASAKEKTITLCNSGVMAVRSESLFPLLASLTNKNAKGEYYLTDLVKLAQKGGKRCAVITGNSLELIGINSRAELACAEANLQRRLRRKAMENGVTLIDPSSVFFAMDTKLGEDVIIHPHVIFGNGVVVEEGVEIRSFSHIEEAKIRQKAIIGPFARLRPGAVIGKSAHIGNFVEIKKSTIEQGAKINHLSYIGDTNVGERANIGAGTITCNFDGYSKHRTAIGAGAFIGSNTSLIAPVVVGDGAIVGAGSVITEDVEADSLAVSRATQKQKLHWAKTFRNRKNN